MCEKNRVSDTATGNSALVAPLSRDSTRDAVTPHPGRDRQTDPIATASWAANAVRRRIISYKHAHTERCPLPSQSNPRGLASPQT